MSHPLGITTGRMLGAAALSAPYFAALYTVGLLVISQIASWLSPTIGGFSIPSFEIVSWLVYGFVYVAGFAAIAAVLIGFPLSLLARRLLRHARRPQAVIIAAFLVATVAAAIAVALMRPLLFMNIDAQSEDPWGVIGFVAVIEVAAGLSAALAWATLWRLSPERTAARSQARVAVE